MYLQTAGWNISALFLLLTYILKQKEEGYKGALIRDYLLQIRMVHGGHIKDFKARISEVWGLRTDFCL